MGTTRQWHANPPASLFGRPHVLFTARLQLEQLHTLTVDGNLEMVCVRETCAPVAFAVEAAQQVDGDLELAVLRDVVAHQHATACTERQALDLLVLWLR